MKLLKQNYHGLPGIGVNGQTGQDGDRGNSIYFGFINDFFDGEVIGIDTYVYAAKRLVTTDNNTPEDVSKLIGDTLNTAWKVTLAELYQYQNASLNKLVNDASNDLTNPYINYKTFYYTGNRLSSVNMLNSSMISAYGTYEDALSFIDGSTRAVELDINGDYISMSFMLSSASSNGLKDVSQYSFENDETIKNGIDKSEHSLLALYENIESKVSHYEFNNDAAIKMDISSNGEYYVPFNTDDAIYYNSSIVGDLYEIGDFLDRNDCSLYYEYYPKDTSLTYVSQKIKYPLAQNNMLAALDANVYEAHITYVNNELLYDYQKTVNTKGIDTQNIAAMHWDLLFKTSAKININDPVDSKRLIIENDDLLDDEGNAFYGIPSRILFNNRSKNTSTELVETQIIPEFDNYFDLNEKFYSDYASLMISDNYGANIYYTLNSDDTKVFIPFTLSSKFKIGDVLYFYTDQMTFNNNHNIEYMVVITEDLLNCTPTQLINAALLQNPLDINLFSNIFDGRLTSFHNIAVLYDLDNNISTNKLKLLSNKSYISIVDEYSDSPLLLCSNSSFASLNASINGLNKLASAIIEDDKFMFDINNYEIPLKMSNLCVNTNYLTPTTNVELYKLVYNSNVILYENNFIKPLLDLDLYHDNANDLQSVFIQNINAGEYFYNVEKLDNYFYGCDIYNKDMEKINTITSTTENLTVEIIPTVNDTVYYILMFASCGSSLKYYSKLSKLTITYSKIELDKITPMKLPTGYNSPIGKYSTKKRKSYNKSIGLYSNRQQITSFKLDIIGEDQQITREKLSGNIIFNISNITSEQISGASLKISTDNNKIEIVDVLFNHNELNNNTSSLLINNWSFVQLQPNINALTYSLNLSTNLPKFNGSDSATFGEYVITGSSTYGNETPTIESSLFVNLKDNNRVLPTKSRSILVTVKYRFTDNSNEYYYENFNIVLPGFEDTRDLPIIKLNTHSNIIDLQTFNSIENNVLTNQFVTYLDVDITDFKKQWGKFANDASISLDLTINNLLYDLDWQHTYVIKDLKPRRTFRGVYNDDDIKAINKINNYVKFNIDLIDSTLPVADVSILLTSLLYKGDEKLYPKIIDDINTQTTIDTSTYSNGKYIIFDNNFIAALKNTKYINSGLLNDIYINLSNIKLNNDVDKIRIKLTTEFGNPIIANMYYRFYVKNMTINVDNNNKKYKFFTLVPDADSLNEPANTTYLCKINKISYSNDKIVDLNFKYISDSLDTTFNPLSYTITPNDVEYSYTDIYGDIYKYGIKELIIKELKFFNSSVYSLGNYKIDAKTIRENNYYDFKNLLIKKSYVLDNIKNINAKPISLYSLINNIDIDSYKSIKIDECIKTHNVLDFIEGNKYLGIVYHSTIMLPKVRNEIYTFYYNDKEYVRTKYDLKINNLPIFAYDELSIELRDDVLINSMDKWNDWYAENYNKNENTYTGILSLYGNGYTQIYEPDTKNVSFYTNKTFTYTIETSGSKKTITLNKESSGKYDVVISLDVSVRDLILDISEVKSLNDVYINEYSLNNEVNIKPMKQTQPNNGEYFRGFLYDINWEFPYYDKNAIVPYRIVSPFDNFLNNCGSDIPEVYQNYYNALTDLSDASYGTHMVPYTLLYDIEPRIAYNYETKGINVFMLRRPSIGVDTDIIDSSIDFTLKYEFNRRLFNIDNFKKLTSPYIIK